MDNFLQMVDTQSVLFLYMAVGFLCQRLGILDGHTQEKLTGLVIKFMMPCMVFMPLSPSKVKEHRALR